MPNLQNRIDAERITVNLALDNCAERLPFEYHQAYLLSTWYAAEHLAVRHLHEKSPSDTVHLVMTAARMEWLLKVSRPTLSNLFTACEMAEIAACFEGMHFFPDQLDDMPDDYCAYVGTDDDVTDATTSDDRSFTAVLAAKLRSLTAVQRIALADTLEQILSVDLKAGRTLEAAMTMRGIVLL